MEVYTQKFIIRTDQIRADGTASISLQVFINGKRAVIGMDMAVHPDCWDAQSQQVRAKRKGVDAKMLNIRLTNTRIKVDTIYNEARLSDRVLTIPRFKDLLSSSDKGNSIVEYWRKWLVQQRGILSPGTLSVYRSTLAAVIAYDADATIGDLNDDWVRGFDRHLRGRGLAVSTATKRHRHTKHILRCMRREWKFDDPYEYFKLRHISGERVFLINTEVITLEKLYASGELAPSQQAVLQAFLFMTHCGLRHGDTRHVTRDMVQDGMLRFAPAKTRHIGKRVTMPVTDKAMTYAHPSGRLVPWRCNQVFNRHMGEIARLAGIRKNITAHVARHTFATGYLAAGGSVEVLQRILGHSNIATTMVYVHITDQRLVAEKASVMDHMYKP